ncbi:MAG: arginine--tRNA ligase, partial [Candidatus Altiarchaeales archaeon]|nr:arginine--tRNA ligase [Candidatus Altiarchaeales archaeon]
DLVAQYLLKLTKAFGGFYMKCPVLDSVGGVRVRRIALVRHTRDVLSRGLGLLGVEAPKRM